MNINSLRLKISHALESRQLNCNQVEKKAGLPRAALRNFINGTVKGPKLEVIMAAANFLEINLNELPLDSEDQTYTFESSSSSFEKTNYELLITCAQTLDKTSQKKNTHHSLEQSLALLKKIYNYCYAYNNQRLDESFVEWCIDNG